MSVNEITKLAVSVLTF